MNDGMPDFIIAGAPRCGTTWLYRVLSRHPDIFMAGPESPEPKFFHVDDIYQRGLDYYRQTWFSKAGNTAVLGEKTSYYLESSKAAARIVKHLPQVKLIFLLRDPATRAFSNYLRSREFGFEHETFANALDQEDERERKLPVELRFVRPHAYFSRGLYAAQLHPYLELFPRRNM
ncbi:MAG: sulfotransferase, partial [Rhodospirillales bacterium]|nr:sulfotransferase [Rhodospirillales bacterium]